MSVKATGKNTFVTADVGTATATGSTANAPSGRSFMDHAIQATKTGTVTAWTVLLEGTLDGVSWSTLATHANTDGDGVIVNATSKRALMTRLRITAMTGSGSLLMSYVSAP